MDKGTKRATPNDNEVENNAYCHKTSHTVAVRGNGHSRPLITVINVKTDYNKGQQNVSRCGDTSIEASSETSTSRLHIQHKRTAIVSMNTNREIACETVPDNTAEVCSKTADPEFNTSNDLVDDADSPKIINEKSMTSVYDVTDDEDSGIGIPEFFKDRHILITGATGFVGQCLVAKLLRSCPDIRRITLPIRVFEHTTLERRFDDYLKKKVFANLWAESPDLKRMLVPVRVTFSDVNLGLIDDVYSGLADDVSVIIHAAATTRVTDALRQTVQENVASTENVLNLAKQCKHLKAFVYVSTAYSQFKEDIIKEEIPSDVTSHDLYRIVQKRDFPPYYDPQKMLDRIGSPCAYMFSKRLAEHVVSECTDLPRVIIRPCIVTSALKEPHPGWTDGYVGINCLMTLLSRKFYRYFAGEKNKPIELIPVDMFVNKVIAGTWCVGTGRHLEAISAGPPLVLNAHTSNTNPMCVKDFIRYVNDFYENRLQTSFRIKRTNSRLKAATVAAIQHMIPIMVRELVTGKILNRKRQSRKVRNQLMGVYLVTAGFDFDRPREYKNCIRIREDMSEDDRQVFYTDPGVIDWHQYILNWLDVCRTVDRK